MDVVLVATADAAVMKIINDNGGIRYDGKGTESDGVTRDNAAT